jgi:His-Xaa-Ser system radical SAM maturase HxsC
MKGGRTIIYIDGNKKIASRTIYFKCNNRCISCITDFKQHSRNQILPLEELKSVIDRIDKDTDVMNFNGGEPTLRKNLFEILLYTRSHLPTATIQLLTNARMFAYKSYTRDFISLGLDNFNFLVTLYGHNTMLHDSITRSPGSFEQTVRGIKNLLLYGQNVEIRVIINRINYRYLSDIAKFVLGNFPTIYQLVLVNLKVTGECYKNRRSTVVPYTDVVPYATKAVDHVRGKLNVRLFHFPLCILPREYWNLARGVTINDKELAHPDICEVCADNSKCARIWKSYADVQGIDEFSPIESYPKIRYFVPKKGKEFSGSLPDIIAVKKGIKPVARLSCRTKEGYNRIKKLCERDSLKIMHSDKTINSQYYLYLSRCEELIRKAMDADTSFQSDKLADSDRIDKAFKFGRLLGYPECCVNYYTEHMADYASDYPQRFNPPTKISFYLNNILNSVSNHYLSFHCACSYNCRETLKYNRGILSSIEEEEPLFAQELRIHLKKPFLMFFDLNLHLNVSWDNRRGFMFDGKLENGVLTYSNVYYIKTNYPETIQGYDYNLGLLFEKLKQGSKIRFVNNSIEIYKDNGIICTKKNIGLYHSLFNFG